MRSSLVQTLVVLLVVLVALPAFGLGRRTDDFVIVFPQPDEEVRFSNDFGDPRSDDRTHEGIDIIGPRMGPVVAAADGVVERIAEGPRAGYYIVIDHLNGYETYYMHLNNDTPGTDDGRGGTIWAYAPGLEVGDAVEAGQLIGFVGDSGNAEETVPHTHFELHRNGRVLNPYAFLKAAWERWQLELQIERGETPFS